MSPRKRTSDKPKKTVKSLSAWQRYKARKAKREARQALESMLGMVVQWQWTLGNMVESIFVHPCTASEVWGDRLHYDVRGTLVYVSNFGTITIRLRKSVPHGTFTLGQVIDAS